MKVSQNTTPKQCPVVSFHLNDVLTIKSSTLNRAVNE